MSKKKEMTENGAILHHYWYLQGTPYPVASRYQQTKQEKETNAIEQAIDSIVAQSKAQLQKKI